MFQPPAGFSPKARSGRDLSCHSSYGSLPREVRDQTPPRTEGSPIRAYTSIEVTNVWGHQSCDKKLDISFVTAKSTLWTFVFHVHLNMGWLFFLNDLLAFKGQIALFKQGRILFYKFPGLRKTHCGKVLFWCFWGHSHFTSTTLESQDEGLKLNHYFSILCVYMVLCEPRCDLLLLISCYWQTVCLSEWKKRLFVKYRVLYEKMKRSQLNAM